MKVKWQIYVKYEDPQYGHICSQNEVVIADWPWEKVRGWIDKIVAENYRLLTFTVRPVI